MVILYDLVVFLCFTVAILGLFLRLYIYKIPQNINFKNKKSILISIKFI